MSDQLSEEVKRLQFDLDKCLSKNEPTERIIDILKSLENIKFTPALIVSSKIANTINATKKKFADDSNVKGLCKQLIQTWKSIYKNETNGIPSADKTLTREPANDGDEAPISKDVPKPAVLEREQSIKSEVDDADDCEKIVASYPEPRKKIITAITDALSLDSDGKKVINPVAFPLAFGVEAEINDAFSFVKDLKGYQGKSRKIFFSLKSNAELRQDLLEGSLTVSSLVQLPNEQLATRAAREMYKKEREDMMLAKRNDYFQITRDQTMRENGLDPDAGGEHTCSRCKGQKTSSYSLQTRSADEPMTVFVTCLTCGKRWRC